MLACFNHELQGHSAGIPIHGFSHPRSEWHRNPTQDVQDSRGFLPIDGSFALVVRFVRLLFPGAKRCQRFFAHQLDHRNFPVQVRKLELPVDERIVKARFRGVRVGARKIDASEPGPVNGSQAHGTWLATGVKLTIREMKIPQLPAGCANGYDFGVRRRIILHGYSIRGLGKNFAVFHDECAERTAAGTHIFERKGDGALHEGVLRHLDQSVCSIAAVNGIFCVVKERSLRRQKYRSAQPIKISATHKPVHNPGAPHPKWKQR
jgi:hypothetical protein